jgi:adenylate cyclase
VLGLPAHDPGTAKLLYVFQDFALDTDRRELRRGDDLLSVEPKVFDLLVHLIGNRERVVSKDDLIAAVWNGRIVSESTLTSCINAARTAIGDSGEKQRFIKTLTRKGIRFVGMVREDQGREDVVLPHASAGSPASLPDKPSIAVLPFTNVSGDAEQEYFADGITDDIIIELSRFSELFVIARNSSFQYKGKSVDVRQVGHDLGVRYLLEGSIRRSGDRVRIGAQLVEAETGTHRWAERYDRKLEDVFAIQDEVVRAIAPVLAAHVHKAEVQRTLLKPPSAWQAHDFYLRGSESLRAYLSSYNRVELHEARRLFEHSLSIDPNYARAYVDLSYTYFTAWINRVDDDFLKPEALDQAYQLARKAVQLDSSLLVALAQLSMVLTFKRRHDEAIAEFERALDLNPNFNDWRFAVSLVYAGEPSRAINVTNALIRRDPFYVPLTASFLGLAHYMLKQYETAIAALAEAASRSPRHRPGRQWLAAAYAQVGQVERAREEAAAVMLMEPNFTIERIAKQHCPFNRSEDAEHLFEGLRKAGLPEK